MVIPRPDRRAVASAIVVGGLSLHAGCGGGDVGNSTAAAPPPEAVKKQQDAMNAFYKKGGPVSAKPAPAPAPAPAPGK